MFYFDLINSMHYSMQWFSNKTFIVNSNNNSNNNNIFQKIVYYVVNYIQLLINAISQEQFYMFKLWRIWFRFDNKWYWLNYWQK